MSLAQITDSYKPTGKFGWHINGLKRLKISLIGFFSILIAASFNVANAQSTTPTSPDLKVASLEQSYDLQVIQILSNYFDRKKFFVDVEIDAEMVEETYTTRQNTVRLRRSPDITMPGLPFLPEENMQRNEASETPETVVNEHTVSRMKIAQLRVNIHADSSFSNEQLDFMRQIAGIAAKINEVRGDEINITQTSMPNLATDPPTVSVEPKEQSWGMGSIFTSLNQYIPGIMLLLVVGLMLYLSRINNNPQQRIDRIRRRQDFKNDDTPSEYLASPGRSPESETEKEEADSESEFDKMIEKFFNQPREVAHLFESWADEKEDEGIKKAARVISTVDQNLIRSIKTELKDNYYTAIKDAASQLPEMTMDEKQELAKEFNAILKSNTSGSGKKQKNLPLFKFLEHISEEQLLKLLSVENNLNSALVLDYLPEQQAAKILDKLHKDRAADIMLKMTRLQDISYKEQKKIASELFEKAMNLMDSEKKEHYKSENILPLLENLPLKEQRQYIEKLKDSDTPVGEFIQNHFLTIDQIPELEDEIIKAAISTINTETLLDAAIGLEEDVVDKLLSVRPKREQRLIRLELQEIVDEDDFDTEYAETTVMNAIRKTAQKYKN